MLLSGRLPCVTLCAYDFRDVYVNNQAFTTPLRCADLCILNKKK